MRKDRFQFPPPRIWPSLLQQDPVAVVECVDAYFSALRNVELFHSSRKHQEIMRKGRLLVDYTEELSVEWLLSRRCLAALETFQDLPEEARRAGVDPLEATLGWLYLYKQIRDVFRSLPGKKELTRLYEEPGLWDILREKLASAVRESIGDLATSEMRKHPHQAAMFQFVSEYFKTHPDDWRLAIFHPSPYDDEILDLEGKPDFGLLDSLCRPAGKSRDLLAQRVREERDKLADLDRRLEKAGRESIAFYQRARMTAGVLLGEATDVLEKRQDPHTRFLVTLLTLRFRELDASYAQVGPDRVERDVLKDEKDWEPIVLPMLWEPEFWFLVLRGLLLVSGGIDARGSIAPWASQLVDRLIHGPRQLHRVPVPPAAARARSLLARRIAPWLVAESTPIDEILEAGPAPYGDLSSPDAARCPEPLMASAGRIRDAAARYLIRLEEMSDAQKDDLRRMCSEFVFPHAHEIAVAMREAALEQIAEGGAGAARPAPPKTPEEVEAEEEERERAAAVAAATAARAAARERAAVAAAAKAAAMEEIEGTAPVSWSFIRDPQRPSDPGVPLGSADPENVGRFATHFREEGIETVIKVESIVRALRYYESMPVAARQLLPRETVDGIRWSKLKRGRLRILIHEDAEDRARFHVYPRSEYLGPLEFLTGPGSRHLQV